MRSREWLAQPMQQGPIQQGGGGVLEAELYEGELQGGAQRVCGQEQLNLFERRSLHYIKANYILAIISTVTAIVATVATVLILWWGWTQHYLLYRRNHIHHRQVAREEARQKKSRNRYRNRYRNRSRVRNGTTFTSGAESHIGFPEPVYRRETVDLQAELETIVNEARARQERLRVSFTMQELEAALELCPQLAPAA